MDIGLGGRLGGQAMEIFAPDGTHLGTIQLDEVVANAAWGDDGSTLYMTASTGLYRIRLTTEGVIL